MAHIMNNHSYKIDRTDPAWLPIGGQFNEVVNEWADRSDIVTYVGKGAGLGSPACFIPDIAEMHVNTKLAFGKEADPALVPDLTVRENQFEYPVAMGAVLHEAMHAKHTEWDLASMHRSVKSDFVKDLVTDFEEIRIEHLGLQALSANRALLRACAMHLVIAESREAGAEKLAELGNRALSKLLILACGRVEAGVLDEADVKLFRDTTVKHFGEELVNELLDICRRSLTCPDHDWRPLEKLALEWESKMSAAGFKPEAGAESMPDWLKELLAEIFKGMPPASGDVDEDAQTARDIMSEIAGDVEVSAQDEANQQMINEMLEGQAAKANAANKEKDAHEKAAEDAFGRGTGPGPTNSYSRLVKSRPPTGPERSAAVGLSKDLERARYRDRVAVKKSSVVPPGKLNTRAAMAGSIQRSQGRMMTAEPWKRTIRHHTEDPDLTVGVMVDISGSMSAAMEPMAVTAWVMSEAIRRVQGKAAMMYFGNDVFPVLAPGQHLDEVKVYSASDGTERFKKGFEALNGKLRLLGSRGARLLVVVSDLYHQPDEVAAETEWFQRCKRDGVAVIVICPSKRDVDRVKRIVGNNGTVIQMNDHTDTPALARVIGAAAVRELQAASR